MRKGQLVRISQKKAFTKANGGERVYPIATYYQDDRKQVPGYSKYTEDEIEKFLKQRHVTQMGSYNFERKSFVSNRLFYNPLKPNKVYICVRARVQVTIPNQSKSPQSGYCLLLDSVTGDLIYAERCYLEVIDDC